jgi:hypothetical protein
MSQRIRFNDDLFYITETLKAIRDGLTLDIDPDIFAENAVATLEAMGQALDRLSDFINENPKLIDRAEYVRSIYLVERQYVEILETALGDDSSLKACIDRSRPGFAAFLDAHRAAMSVFRTRLYAQGGDEHASEDLVSRDELDGLLKDEGS